MPAARQFLQDGARTKCHVSGESTYNQVKITLEAYSTHGLPIVEALIRYFHAAAGYPVCSTWLTAISAGNYSSWPGLTLANATKYYPSTTDTIMGHLVQKL